MAAFPDKDHDGGVGCSFGCEFDGIQIKSISEVSGLKMEQDVIEYKQNTAADGKYLVKKLPGRWKAGECTLTRALTDDQSFDKWVKDSQLGKMKDVRKNGFVIVYDYEGKAVKRYKLTNAWPKTLELSSMKAGDTSVLTEKLVLTYEKCEPESA
jgi:phage tail-like protein